MNNYTKSKNNKSYLLGEEIEGKKYFLKYNILTQGKICNLKKIAYDIKTLW